MTDWEKLQSVYNEYRSGLAEYGWKDVSLVPPAGSDSGSILAKGVFKESCGVVVAESALTSHGGQLRIQARVARSAVGNRGWHGGSKAASPDTVRACVLFTNDYFGDIRQLLS